jgi:quinoprotein glucose dehydrogenase
MFDRVTGQPIFPIEERPVEQSTVPDEKTTPTQPFVTKPPAYDRQGFSLEDLINFTPELNAQARELVKKYKIGPIFTPPVVSKAEGPLATLALATAGGGTVWAGGSLDPETGIAYLYSRKQLASLGLVASDPKVRDFAYVQGLATTGARSAGGAGSDGSAVPGDSGAATTTSVQGLPLYKPPYGQITAIDMNKGDILWQVPHGETPDLVKNHPALKGLNIPRTGRAGIVGTLVTKSLIIAGEPGTITMPDGTRGAYLRAYDKKTGQDAGAIAMPAGQTGSPMTYMHQGKQYIIVAIGAGGYPAEYVAYRVAE